MVKQRFVCAKCGSPDYSSGEIRTTGSGVSRFLNMQNQKFAVVSCTGCGYSDLYRMDGSGISNIFDIFTN